MKTLSILTILCFFSLNSIAQTVGIGTESPNPKSALDIKATGIQGLLIPRLRATDTTAFGLSNNDKGMLFYDTLSGNIYVWSGIKWNSFKSSNLTPPPNATTWNTTGNSSISPQLTLGTITNTPIQVKTNNINVLTVGSNGKIGIGNLSDATQLTSDLVVRRKDEATDGTNGVFIDLINDNQLTANSLNGIRFSNYATSTINTHISGHYFFKEMGLREETGNLSLQIETVEEL